METNLQKWGNSLGVRLPRTLAARKALTDGKPVRLTETETGILIEPIETASAHIDTLVKKITNKNKHDEVSWGSDIGKEVW